jgi:hypothetical protein
VVEDGVVYDPWWSIEWVREPPGREVRFVDAAKYERPSGPAP